MYVAMWNSSNFTRPKQHHREVGEAPGLTRHGARPQRSHRDGEKRTPRKPNHGVLEVLVGLTRAHHLQVAGGERVIQMRPTDTSYLRGLGVLEPILQSCGEVVQRSGRRSQM